MSTKIIFYHLQNFFLKPNLSQFILEIFTYLLLRCISLSPDNMQDIKTKPNYLKGIQFCNFRNFKPFSQIFVPVKKVSKPQNREIKYLSSLRYFFCNIGWEYDIDTRISHVSTYSNEIRVFVTYLITFRLINNRKIDIEWDFRFLFSLKSRN